MKKRALALFLAMLLVLALAACGSASSPTVANDTDKYYAYTGSGGIVSDTDAAYAPEQAESEPAAEPQPDPDGQPVPVSDKIIYSAGADVETKDFDASLKAVDALIARVGGFLESSSVTGSNYYSGRDYRSADYTIRIPAGSFKEVTGSLSDIGNVTYCNTNAENITSQYTDTQRRLEAYEIEYDRLLAMLEKAASVEEMLSIEQRLSEVRYSIESLTTTISGWDSLINYSTLRLSITEVKELTTAAGSGLTYWQEVGLALSNTLSGLGRFFSNALMFLIAALPVLAVLAVVAIVVIVVVKKLKSRRAKKQDLPPPPPDK